MALSHSKLCYWHVNSKDLKLNLFQTFLLNLLATIYPTQLVRIGHRQHNIQI